MQVVLGAAYAHPEGGIHDVQVWVHTQCGRKEHVATGGITVEEVTVIEVAVGAGVGDGLRRLMDRIVIALGEHRAYSRQSP